MAAHATVKTVNSTSEAQMLDFFEKQGANGRWRDRLVIGTRMPICNDVCSQRS